MSAVLSIAVVLRLARCAAAVVFEDALMLLLAEVISFVLKQAEWVIARYLRIRIIIKVLLLDIAVKELESVVVVVEHISHRLCAVFVFLY